MRTEKFAPPPSGLLSASGVSDHQIEAARYAVLRRVAPCLRHDLVRPLQPIGLIYGVMHHKLGAAEPDLNAVRAEADKINEFAKAALEECLVVGTWLAPEAGVLIRLDTGVRDCVRLLASMLHFCGFHLENEIEEMPAWVQRDALRMVLSAALLALTDSMTEPATLTISAEASQAEVTVLLKARRHGEGNVDRYEDGYRKLVWSDVQSLAAAGNVGLLRESDQVMIRFALEAAVPDARQLV